MGVEVWNVDIAVYYGLWQRLAGFGGRGMGSAKYLFTSYTAQPLLSGPVCNPPTPQVFESESPMKNEKSLSLHLRRVRSSVRTDVNTGRAGGCSKTAPQVGPPCDYVTESECAIR